MDGVQDDGVLLLLKALGNPVRLNILHFLVSGEKCVCKIFAQLQLPQNLVSHHLGILRKNRLITCRKDGKWVLYSLNTGCIVRLLGYIESFSAIKNYQ